MSIIKQCGYEKIKSYVDKIHMTGKSKTLLKYLFSCEKANAAKSLAGYSFLGTRDTTMVLIINGILVCVGDVGINNSGIKPASLSGLFRQMGRGNGSGAKQRVETEYFKKLLRSLFEDSGIDEKKINKIVEKIIKYVGKISKWKFSKSTVKDYVMPIIQKTLSDQIYTAFSIGFGTRKDKKSEDNIDPSTMVLDTTRQIEDQLAEKYGSHSIIITAYEGDDYPKKTSYDISKVTIETPIYADITNLGNQKSSIHLYIPTEKILNFFRKHKGSVEETVNKLYSLVDHSKIENIIKITQNDGAKRVRTRNIEGAIPKILNRISNNAQTKVREYISNYITSNANPPLLPGTQIVAELVHYKNSNNIDIDKVLSENPKVCLCQSVYFPKVSKDIVFRIFFEDSYLEKQLRETKTPKEMGAKEKELEELLINCINVEENFKSRLANINKENKDYRDRILERRNKIYEALRHANNVPWGTVTALENESVDALLSNEKILDNYESMVNGSPYKIIEEEE